ncbi:MAG TPA: alpha/beta hydrolase [Candidatus Saccharimonadales bacterium]|nr:alpha/beta hydrolase [Candidatus Saccharimonadales bacterium]
MKNSIILHGKPDPGQEEYYNPAFPAASNSHWIPWLQKQLIIHDITTQTPEIPNAWKPEYETWRKEFERYDITPETILVGHSCGAGFIVRWLSEHPDVHVGTVVWVAPSLGIDWDTNGFFDFEIDPKLTDRTQKLVILVSDDDRDAIQQAAKKLQATIPGIKYREFHGYGHFTLEDMKTIEFPELVEEILQ